MPVNLVNVPLFGHLRKTDRDAIAKKMELKSFRRNAVVLNEGEFSQSLYFILSGRVRIYLRYKTGKEFILDVKGPGEYFGEMVLDGGPRSASVSTVEPCQFAVIPATEFKKLLVMHPEMTLHVVNHLIRMSRILNANVRSLAMLDVYGRVSRILLDLAVEQDGLLVIPHKPTQQEMANRVGSSREVIGRILKNLTASGHIRIQGKRIIVTRPLPSR